MNESELAAMVADGIARFEIMLVDEQFGRRLVDSLLNMPDEVCAADLVEHMHEIRRRYEDDE